MNVHELVDELFEVFAGRIGEHLGDSARDLPRALSLAPVSAAWSRVFSHEVTLGAPALFVEAMPEVDRSVVRDAVLAHLLAVIDAFGTDRIEDEQIEGSPEIFAVLGQARRERDRALCRMFGGATPIDLHFRGADALTMRAVRSERAILLPGRAASLETYERTSLDKQGAAIIASIALARVAGWEGKRLGAVRAILEGISLGLQIADDVVDWEDDARRGGAWAISLMRGTDRTPSGVQAIHGNVGDRDRRVDRPESIRETVLQSGVLGTMLSRASVHMQRARRRASAIGAARLAAWAGAQEAKLRDLAEAEARSAGYAVRARALAAWACEVLA